MKNKDYHLLHVFEANKGITIKQLVELSKDDYEKIKKNKIIILNYFRNLDLFQCLDMNIEEFLKVVMDSAINFHSTRQMYASKMDLIFLNIGRLLLNILSMFRSLLDHIDSSFSKEFGKNSTEKNKWCLFLNSLYDSSFEYRLMYGLRNYAQHVGIPPLNINFTEERSQKGISFRLDLNKNELLNDNKIKKKLKVDLDRKPEKIPMIEILNNWRESLKKVQNKLEKIKMEKAKEAASNIIQYRNNFNILEGALCVSKLPIGKKDFKSLKLNFDWLPEEKALNILNLEQP